MDNDTYSSRRAFVRFETNLFCYLVMPSGEVSARVVNLSAGGAGVAFNSAVFGPKPLDIMAIDIKGIGRLDTVQRWRTNGAIGVAFRRDAARVRVQTFLRDFANPLAICAGRPTMVQQAAPLAPSFATGKDRQRGTHDTQSQKTLDDELAP